MKRLFTLVFIFMSLIATAQQMQTVVQKLHTDQISSLLIDRERNILISGSYDKNIKIWDLATHRIIRTLQGHELSIRSLHLEGDDLYSGSADGSVIHWDIQSGKIINKYPVHQNMITDFVKFKDESRFISGGYDWNAHIWNSKDIDSIIKVKVSPNKGTGTGVSIDISANQKLIAIGQDGREVKIISPKGDILHDISLQKEGRCGGCGSALKFAKNGSKVFVAASRTGIASIDASSGRIIKSIKDDSYEDIRSVDVYNDLLVVGSEKKVYLYKASNLTLINTFELTDFELNKCIFGRNPNEIIIGSNQNNVFQLKINTQKITPLFKGIDVTKGDFKADAQKNNYWTRNLANYLEEKQPILLAHDDKWIISGKIGRTIKVVELKSGKVIATLNGHEKEVITLALSPNKKLLASSDVAGHVSIWDIDKLNLIHTYEVDNRHHPVLSLSWISDHEVMCGTWSAELKKINTNLKQVINVNLKLNSSVNFMLPVQNNLYTFTYRFNQPLELIDPESGDIVKTYTGHKGRVLQLCRDNSSNGVITVAKDKSLRVWDFSTQLMQMKMKFDKVPSAVKLNHTGQILAVGNEQGELILYNRISLKELHRIKLHQGQVREIIFTHNDQYIITRSTEGEIVLFDTENHKKLFSWYFLNEKDWVVVSEDGYFDGTESGFSYIHYVKGLKTYNLNQFFKKYYNPGVLKTFFTLEDHHKPTHLLKEYQDFPPPVITFDFPKTGGVVQNKFLDVMIAVKDDGGGIQDVIFKQNGKRISNNKDRNLNRSPHKGKRKHISYKLELVPGPNIISVSATSIADVESDPIDMMIQYDGEEYKPNCYILSVGLNTYKNPVLDLNYGKADAQEFSSTLKKGGKSVYDNIIVTELYDEKATKPSIVAALKNIQEKAKAGDVFVFYYAGHGSMYNHSFYFIPHETIRLSDQPTLDSTAIKDEELQAIFAEIKALKQIIIMDACHSGGSIDVLATRGANEEKALAQLSRSAGIHIFASAGSDQLATEFRKLGHGIFTYILIEALNGKADGSPKDNQVSVYEIKSYLDAKMPELSKKLKGSIQFPYTFSRGHDFPVVID